MSAPKKRGLPRDRRMRHDKHYVDMVTQAMGEGIGRMLPVDGISSNQDQPRATLGDLADLVSSISKHGILEPLLVRVKESESGDGALGYELVSGERRFHAALEAGLREVPCIELKVSDDVALEIALVENLQRKDLSPFEEGEGFRTLIDKYEYTHDQVAQAVGRSRVTVTETLKLLELPPEIRDLCRHADIAAKGMLLEIAKAQSAEAMQQLIQEIVEDRLDRSALRMRRQEIAEGAAPGAEEAEGGSDEGSEASSTGSADDTETAAGRAASRPFVVKLSDSDRRLTVSLSFRTEKVPETRDVIAALETMIQQLRADIRDGTDKTKQARRVKQAKARLQRQSQKTEMPRTGGEEEEPRAGF